ncbi:DinB family protein [Oceanobacillus kapialis]|uniref:DinB family protein n=1 Tax=Oceanobacillus kapialis TaxID=481353 RepID=A0ABW5Q3W3_9BACI
MKINDEARDKLWEEVAALSDEELNKRPCSNEWSIAQVMEHLYLMERTVVHNIKHTLENGSIKEVSTKPIELTVNRSRKIEAPTFVEPSDSDKTIEVIKEKLHTSHESLRKLDEDVDKERLEEKTAIHPVFGEMNLAQWIPFVGYHELRHIEQIKEVKDKLGLTK